MTPKPSNTFRRHERRDPAGPRRDLPRQIPDDSGTHHALGVRLLGAGDYASGLWHLDRAFHLGERNVRLTRDRAIGCAALHRWSDAMALLEPALADLDVSALGLFLAASVECGESARAVHTVERLGADLEADPQTFCEYGRALRATGDVVRAEAVLLECVARDPAAMRPRNALVGLYETTGRSDLALAQWIDWAAVQPDNGAAQLKLAIAFAQHARLHESRAARRRALMLELTPDEHALALFLMLFDGEETGHSICAAYRAAFSSASPTGPARRIERRKIDGRLRVGYVGGEFKIPPAPHFLRPFLEAHDRANVEVFAYHTNVRAGAEPPEYLDARDRWRHVPLATEGQLCDLIEDDGIDVLVDVSGHFPGNRLSVFAARAAPVQATLPRFPSTTGCTEIDYLFTDIWTSPEGSDSEYVERLHRISTGYLAYALPEAPPAILPLPRRQKGYPTFGVIQRPIKLSPAMWDLFADVLRASPGSRLLLHYGDDELDEAGSPTAQHVRQQFSMRDIDPSRIDLTGRRPMTEHLQVLSSMDVALDTSPYNGQTTTIECLWMGVPVVTLGGSTHASRVSAGLLARAGLPQLATASPAAYVAAAANLAGDEPALSAIRDTLRERASGLVDGTTLARAMESAYRTWSGV